MVDRPPLNAEYDDIADVLYLTLGRDRSDVTSIEDAEGFVWRRTRDGHLIGVTIQDFRHQYSSSYAIAELTDRLVKRFRVTRQEAKRALEHA